MSFCAYSERCHQDVEQKLYKMSVPSFEHDEYIAELIEQNFLNESRYTELFIRSKFNQKKWGKRKIIQHLLQKGITQRQIDLCIDQAIDKETYQQTMTNIILQKVDQFPPELSIFLKRKKIYQYLQQRGFENFEIIPLLDLLIK